MYREIRDVHTVIETIQSSLTDAIMATATKDMIELTGKSQALTVAARDQLDSLLNGRQGSESSPFGEPKVDRRNVQTAMVRLSEAFDDAEKVPLGTDVDGMRFRLIMYKSRIDYADAYLQVALGTENRV